MLNNEGFWLLGLESRKEWSFMFPRETQHTFGTENPDIWSMVQSAQSRDIIQKNAKNGLYTLSFVTPEAILADRITVVTEDAYWLNGNFIPTEQITQGTSSLIRSVIVVDLILIVTILFVLYFLAQANQKEIQNKTKVQSINELLTITNKILRHDLANKFTSIKLLSDIKPPETISSAHAQDINESSQEGIDTIKNMRNLTIAPSKNLQKSMPVLPILKKIASRSKIKINITGENLSVQADDTLPSVFKNIIENAVIHGNTPRLDINTTKRNNFAIITFTDYGKGIPSEIKGRLFEEGFSHGETGNTGIGLFIVKRNIERYGGFISIAENEPTGAIFSLSIPIA